MIAQAARALASLRLLRLWQPDEVVLSSEEQLQ